MVKTTPILLSVVAFAGFAAGAPPQPWAKFEDWRESDGLALPRPSGANNVGNLNEEYGFRQEVAGAAVRRPADILVARTAAVVPPEVSKKEAEEQVKKQEAEKKKAKEAADKQAKEDAKKAAAEAAAKAAEEKKAAEKAKADEKAAREKDIADEKAATKKAIADQKVAKAQADAEEKAAKAEALHHALLADDCQQQMDSLWYLTSIPGMGGLELYDKHWACRSNGKFKYDYGKVPLNKLEDLPQDIQRAVKAAVYARKMIDMVKSSNYTEYDKPDIWAWAKWFAIPPAFGWIENIIEHEN